MDEERIAIMEGRLTAVGLDQYGPGPTSYAEARVCDDPGCVTVLSRYNPGSKCWQHESRHPFHLDWNRRKKRRNLGPTVIDATQAGALVRVPTQMEVGKGDAA
jgi:hypothetical protein